MLSKGLIKGARRLSSPPAFIVTAYLLCAQRPIQVNGHFARSLLPPLPIGVLVTLIVREVGSSFEPNADGIRLDGVLRHPKAVYWRSFKHHASISSGAGQQVYRLGGQICRLLYGSNRIDHEKRVP